MNRWRGEAGSRLLQEPWTEAFYWGVFAARGYAIQWRVAYFVDIAAPCEDFVVLAHAELPSFSWPALSAPPRWSPGMADGVGRRKRNGD